MATKGKVGRPRKTATAPVMTTAPKLKRGRPIGSKKSMTRRRAKKTA
jgi:hypothetical protein